MSQCNVFLKKNKLMKFRKKEKITTKFKKPLFLLNYNICPSYHSLGSRNACEGLIMLTQTDFSIPGNYRYKIAALFC